MAQDSSEVTLPAAGSTGTPATSTASAAPTTAQIRAEIEDTRAEMSDTIDAIQERLSPGRFLSHAKETVKDATLGRVKSLAQRTPRSASPFDAEPSVGTRDFLQLAEDNPAAVALLSLAATGILLRAFGRRPTASRRQGGERAEQASWQRQVNAARTRRRNVGFLTAASAGAACWAIWRAQGRRPAFQEEFEPQDNDSVRGTRPLPDSASDFLDGAR